MKTSRILESIETATPMVEMGGLDPDQERLYDELYLIASNDGSSYKKRDAKGAVDKAFREHQKNEATRLREDFSVVKKKLVKDLAKRWQNEDVEGGGEPLEEMVSYSNIYKAAKNVVNETVWKRELAKLGLDVEKIPLSAEDISPYIGPIITLMLTRNGYSVDASSKAQAKRMLTTLKQLASESENVSFQEVLAEAKGRSFADFQKKAMSDFLRSAIPRIKKIAGNKAERVEVSGVTVPLLKYEGQDMSDMDLKVVMSIVPMQDFRVELMHWYESAMDGKKKGTISTKTGLLTTDTLVQTFQNAFGRA